MPKYADREKGIFEHNDSESKLQESEELRLDPYGIPLKPQPSRFADDPLVRSYRLIFLAWRRMRLSISICLHLPMIRQESVWIYAGTNEKY